MHITSYVKKLLLKKQIIVNKSLNCRLVPTFSGTRAHRRWGGVGHPLHPSLGADMSRLQYNKQVVANVFDNAFLTLLNFVK